MKWLVVIFALLVAGAILGPVSSGNAGYVLLQFAGWSVETSVIALAIMIIVISVAIALVVAIVRAFLNRTRKGGRWFSKRRQQKADELTTDGLNSLLQQDYMSALQAFEKANKKQSTNSHAALASYAAQQSGELGKAEFWREQAGKSYAETYWILDVKKVGEAQRKDPENAARQMTNVLEREPKDQQTWRLATQVYKTAEHWQKLAQLLPAIEKYAGYSAEELSELKRQISYQRFVEEGTKGNNALLEYWNSLSKNERSTDVVRLSYAAALKHFGKKEACAKITYKGLKRGEIAIEQANQSGLLVASYPKLVEYVQDTLKRNPDHTGFLKALSLLAIDSKDYSLAQRALKKLIEKAPDAENYKLLGDVYNSLGDSQLAANAYQKALA